MHLAHHGAGVVADVADAAPEQADVVGPGPGGHDRLVVRHAAGAVDADVAPPQLGDHRQLVPADRHLDVQVRVVAEVADELLGLRRSSRSGSVVKTSTLRGMSQSYFCKRAIMSLMCTRKSRLLLLGQDRRIGGHAAGEAALEALLQFLQVGGIDEQFHRGSPCVVEDPAEDPVGRLGQVARRSGRDSSASRPLYGVSTSSVRQPAAWPAATSLQRSPTMKAAAQVEPPAPCRFEQHARFAACGTRSRRAASWKQVSTSSSGRLRAQAVVHLLDALAGLRCRGPRPAGW